MGAGAASPALDCQRTGDAGVRRKSLILAGLHIGLVGSLWLKLQWDRAMLPRGWVRVQPAGPHLPIRGRYVSLRVAVPLAERSTDVHAVRLLVRGDRVIAQPDPAGLAVTTRDGEAVLSRTLAFFISGHVSDSSQQTGYEQLWAEVTIPSHGPPRPIRLAVQREGQRTLLPLR